MEPQEKDGRNIPANDVQQNTTERRSIRDLRISRPQAQRPERTVPAPQQKPLQRVAEPKQAKKSLSKYFIPASILGLGVLLLVVLLPVIFPDATVTVTPKSADGIAKTTVIATFDPESPLPYSIATWTKEASAKIPATKSVTVAEKASGKIVIENKNTSEQKLIKNTRFESTTGKVYRIRDSITVPAAKKGSATEYGSLEVTVYADEGGESYNIQDTSFTLPGLKGSDLFGKVTAKSKSAISGGFTGEKKSADEPTMSQARTDLKKQIEADSALPESLATGTIALKNTLKSSFESAPDVASDTEVAVTEKVTYTVLTIDAKKLAYALASEAGSHVESKDVSITNIDALQISVPDNSISVATSKKDLTISVDGTPHFVWNIDVAQLKKDLAGATRDEVTTIQKRYTNIERAVTTIRPFWRNTLPGNADRISVIIEQQKPAL